MEYLLKSINMEIQFDTLQCTKRRVTAVTVETIMAFHYSQLRGKFWQTSFWRHYRPLQRWQSQKANVDFVAHALKSAWYSSCDNYRKKAVEQELSLYMVFFDTPKLLTLCQQVNIVGLTKEIWMSRDFCQDNSRISWWYGWSSVYWWINYWSIWN